MTLLEFFKEAEKEGRPNFGAWVKVKGFNALYLRYGQRSIDRKRVFPVLDIASVDACKPGNGAFTKFLARLKKMRPNLHLYVESVLSPRFCTGLEKRGFKRNSSSRPLAPDYYKLAESDGVLTGPTQGKKAIKKNRAQRAKKAA